MTLGLPKARVYGTPTWPALVPRAPLPPFPTPINYDYIVPFRPPKDHDLYFYRGNFCGLHMGLPEPPGGSRDVVMAALLNNYSRENQDKFLLQYAQDGYTHLQRSIGHSIYYGHSVYEHVELSKRVQGDYGLFCDEWFLCDEWGLFRATVDQWKEKLGRIVDELLEANVVDHACVGWQLDKYNAPGNQLIEIIKYFAELIPQDVPLYTHWMNEALAWWLTNIDQHTGQNLGEVWTDQYGSIRVMDRFTWWQAMQPYLTGAHHQGNTTEARTNPQLYQDRMKDTLDPFRGHTGKGNMGQSRRGGVSRDFALTTFESTAQDQFDGRCSEDEGDLVGYLMTCTTSFNGKGVNGYGNGARWPDGTRL